MIRPPASLLAIAAAAAIAGAAPAPAAAQPQPTAEQIEQAKKAFLEGKVQFDKGKYGDAVEKFKESYRLSRNPLLLFNIALTFERLGTKDMALFYYRKFLTDAPKDAAQRADAEASVAALEKEGVGAQPDPFGVDDGATTTTEEPVEEPKPKKKAAACTVDEIQHQIVEDAPPGKPLDLTAFVPEECGWTVILHYRGAGDDKFTAVPMRTRYNELVARVPEAEMKGNAVQYYVEIKGADGGVVHRIGKSTSPNVVYLDVSARPRYYPDLEETVGTGGDEPRGRGTFVDEEDPLTGRKRAPVDDDPPPLGGDEVAPAAAGPGGGFTDVGSSKFSKVKWAATGTAAGGVVLWATFSLMASSWAGTLEGEAAQSTIHDDCADPPCRTFDSRLQGIQATGERWETIGKVSLGIGVVAGVVAGYYWYQELRGGKRREKVATPATGLRSIIAAPVAGEDFFGGAAALRF